MKIIQFLVKYRLPLLLVLSLYIVLSVDFNLLKIPEIFKGGHKFQNLFYQLALGTLVAMPLYLLVIYLPEKKTKKAFKEYLKYRLFQFYNETEAIFMSMKVNQNYTYTQGLPNDDEVIRLFAVSKPNDLGSKTLGDVTLWEQIVDWEKSLEKLMTDVAIHSKTIDPELEKKLVLIYRSSFFFTVRITATTMPSHPDLSSFGNRFLITFPLIKELSDYCKKEYGIMTIEELLKIGLPQSW